MNDWQQPTLPPQSRGGNVVAVAGFLLGVLSLVIAPFLAVFPVVMTTVPGAVALHAPLLVVALAGIVVSGVGFVVGWRRFAGRAGVPSILGFVAGSSPWA
ncbi:hypothetical protein ACFYXQ_12095 [Nocardia jiangxiensis]|uniref:Uncharacterized protein n=1 Tax=Nocardia jiangxiensis TaxID=282685 RepID=A0ABW6RZY0_9NOCA